MMFLTTTTQHSTGIPVCRFMQRIRRGGAHGGQQQRRRASTALQPEEGQGKSCPGGSATRYNRGANWSPVAQLH